MEKFIPYEKLSKKQKRVRDAARRGSWGGLSPVTRRAENPKAYKRKKARIEEELDRAFLCPEGDFEQADERCSSLRWEGRQAFVLQACGGYGKVWERTREGMTAHEAAF